jgi:hypothetical protein
VEWHEGISNGQRQLSEEEESFILLKSFVKKQSPNNEFTRAFEKSTETTGEVLKGFISLTFILGLVLAPIIGRMFNWINTVQIITMIPMLRVVLPSLVVLTLSIVIDLTEFDILDADWTTSLIFVYEEYPSQEF